MRKIGIAAFTARGKELAGRIREGLLQKNGTGEEWEVSLYESGLKDWCRAQFESHSDGIIFVGAAGIAVRSVAPFLKSKTTDPAVLVLDEAGQYVIPLLSGHIGGANRLALMLAGMTGAAPVITTATDVNGKFAVDVFAKDNHLKIGSMKAAKEISAAVLRGEKIGLYCEGKIEGTVPGELLVIPDARMLRRGVPARDGAGDGSRETFRHVIWIGARAPGALTGAEAVSEKQSCPGTDCSSGHPHRQGEASGRECPGRGPVILHLIPRDHILGVGCRRGKTEEEIEAVVREALARAGISMDRIFAAATIDLKKEEKGLLDFCLGHGLSLVTYTARELLEVDGVFSGSEFVRETTGVDNVCERAALRLSGEGGRLVQKKYARNGVTAAAAVRDWSVRFE